MDHVSSLGKSEKIEIVSAFFPATMRRLEINYRGKNAKKKQQNPTNTRKLNRALLNNQEIAEEIKEEIFLKCTETNDAAKTTTQNLSDTVKAALEGERRAVRSHLKKQEKASH